MRSGFTHFRTQAWDAREQKSLAALQGFVARTRFELVSPP